MLRQVCKIFLSRVENSSSRRKFNITQIRRNFSASMALPVCYHSSHEIPEGIECDRKVKSSGLLISRREAFGSRTVLEGNSIVEFPRGNSLSREWRGKAESGGRRSVGEGWEVGGSEEAASHPWRIARIIVSGSLYRSMVIDQWIQAIKIQANL